MPGLGAALSRRFSEAGLAVSIGARDGERVAALAAEIVPGSLAGMEAERFEGFVERARPCLVRAQIEEGPGFFRWRKGY